MARITVEDCIDKFPSRFELVLIASNRARKLHSGENPTIEIDNDKNTVIALREIAEETLSKEQLQNDLIEEYQTTTFSEDEDINELEDNSDENQSVSEELDADENKQVDENQSESEEVDTDENKQVDENVNLPTEEAINQTSQDNLVNSSNEDDVQDI